MKKAFMILGACIAAAFVMVSCQDDKKPDNKDNKDNKDPEENLAMDVQIDGNFAEWDALTADNADGEYTLVEENTDAEFDGLLRLKLTSDADYIYVYTEVKYDYIYEKEDSDGPVTGGGSWTGWIPTHSGDTPGALFIYVGCDNDDSGAFAARNSLWDYTGFDAFPQFYFCFDKVGGKMAFGWNQNNWPQNHGYTADQWGEPLGSHGDGWWGDDVEGTPVSDNTVSDGNSFKFSDVLTLKEPASGKDVQAVKIEFAMDRSALVEDGTKVSGVATIGAFYENVDHQAHQTNAEGSGKLPSGDKALKLKLK